MAYKPVDRSFNKKYLEEQHRAIRWLAEQGLTHEEIRVFNWGNVMEDERALRIFHKVCSIRYDRETGMIAREENEREIRVALVGTECEHFFLKSRIWCHWAFLREKPKTWRRKGSAGSLYSLSDIQRICAELTPQLSGNILTLAEMFGTMKVSKLNITKSKSQRQEIETKVVEA